MVWHFSTRFRTKFTSLFASVVGVTHMGSIVACAQFTLLWFIAQFAIEPTEMISLTIAKARMFLCIHTTKPTLTALPQAEITRA